MGIFLKSWGVGCLLRASPATNTPLPPFFEKIPFWGCLGRRGRPKYPQNGAYALGDCDGMPGFGAGVFLQQLNGMRENRSYKLKVFHRRPGTAG